MFRRRGSHIAWEQHVAPAVFVVLHRIVHREEGCVKDNMKPIHIPGLTTFDNKICLFKYAKESIRPCVL